MRLRWVFIGFAAGLLFALSPGCGTPKARCSAGNCNGCCDINDRCQGGSNPVACGVGGGLCVACVAGQTCVAGVCSGGTSGCGPTNCGGCCAATGCVNGSSPFACGGGGLACATCQANEACEAGRCVAQSGSDGGADAGGDAGVDGGTGRAVTIAQAKQATLCSELLSLRGVVVSAVDNSYRGSLGDYNAQFWVVDPNDAASAILVDKYFTDTPGPYEPAVGDLLDIDGYLVQKPANSDREGYRLGIRSQFNCSNGPGKLVITQRGTGTVPADLVAAAGFGDANGGWDKPNANLAGTRVHLPGPLTLVEPNPLAFKRVSALSSDQLHYGFEVTGGVLVNNYKTYRADGGCDWRGLANGGASITFPNGISGVWDTYTHAPCADGGTSSSCKRDAGFIPGTTNDYTYVLYPQSCADVPGQ